MPSFYERLNSKLKRLSEKEKSLERLNKSIEKTREEIKSVNKEIADLKEAIQVLETRILTETMTNRGINVSDIAEAIEAGLFDKTAPEKPPEATDNSVEENCATYSTENNETSSEKEDLDDEISSSGETVGGA